MKRSELSPALVTAGLIVLLGGGLLGWHRYLDASEHRPPAVDLAHGECMSTLADPAFAGLLGATQRVRLDTQYRPGDDKSGPVLICVVQGGGGRTLTASALGLADGAPAPGDTVGTARFDCGPAGRTRPYLATVRLTGDTDHPVAGPGATRMAELAAVFARAAAGTQALDCARDPRPTPTG
ncbi:hypothetical protein [Kitasatospora sp. A2-31]|uniref:hypothetical protein n=1 Tax=Kitasatospora sp. A2-31 TaxID=2916414 RepID=UPI001EEC6AD1|nr:hypothetical protein [Kitasatospora sp. A2-31]MCG6494822.1 hypothetical protein [Kitasatospora sp. A2-31]